MTLSELTLDEAVEKYGWFEDERRAVAALIRSAEYAQWQSDQHTTDQALAAERARADAADRKVKFYEGTDDEWCPEGHARRFIANAREDGDECQICRAEQAEQRADRLKAALREKYDDYHRRRNQWEHYDKELDLLEELLALIQPEERAKVKP